MLCYLLCYVIVISYLLCYLMLRYVMLYYFVMLCHSYAMLLLPVMLCYLLCFMLRYSLVVMLPWLIFVNDDIHDASDT